MSFIGVRLGLIAMLLMIGAVPIYGQDRNLDELDIEALMQVRVETVLGASRFLQKVTEAPATISIVTANEIRAFGYRTVAEVLRRVGGFTVNYDRNYSYVGVRGFQRPGDYNSRILIMVDGHRLNDPIYDMAFVGAEFPVDLEMIDRIEVIRGPSSAVYGTNAFLAVINVITKTGRDIGGVQGHVDAGSFGSFKSSAAFGETFANGLNLQISGSGYTSNGQRRLHFKEFDAPETNHGFAENMDTEATRRLLTSMSFKGFTFQGVYGSREKRVPTAAFWTNFNDPNFETIDKRGFADVRYEREISKAGFLTGRVYYDEYNYEGLYPGEDIYHDFAFAKWWGSEIGLVKHLDRHRISVGAEYRDNFRQKQGGTYDSLGQTVFEDDRRTHVTSAYAEDEFSINDKLILNAGIRHDRYEEFGGTTNPRLGLIYAPAEKTAVKFLWGTAFRAPNSFEMFYNTSSIRANANLEPETIETREVSFEHYIRTQYRLAANLYTSRIRNLISQHVDADGVITSVNADAADTRGVGFEFEARWTSGIGVRASYSYQDARDRAAKSQLDHSVRHLANANFLVPIVPRRLLAGLDVHYVGPAKTLGGDFVPGFVIPNLTLSTPQLAKWFDLSASVYNLFNSSYAHPANSEHLQKSIAQDGRTFRIQLGYSWSRN